MKVGFTGTRNGMTSKQREAFASIKESARWIEFHHGGCQGADVQAARIVDSFVDDAKIVCHPGPDDDPCRTDSGVDDEVLAGKTHFARNRDIVNGCDVLIGCPGVATWQQRGGTFFTMDYAIKHGKPVKVIWPDGRVEDR